MSAEAPFANMFKGNDVRALCANSITNWQRRF